MQDKKPPTLLGRDIVLEILQGMKGILETMPDADSRLPGYWEVAVEEVRGLYDFRDRVTSLLSHPLKRIPAEQDSTTDMVWSVLVPEEGSGMIPCHSQTIQGTLELLDHFRPEQSVMFEGKDNLAPCNPQSYRGVYSHLALDYQSTPQTIKALTAELRDCVGRGFGGYKGGEYTMQNETTLWVARWGEYSGYRILGAFVDSEGVVRLVVEIGDEDIEEYKEVGDRVILKG